MPEVSSLLSAAPWDVAALGMPAWELRDYSAAAMAAANATPGHQTIKVDPLANKRLLHEQGFYYTDTLLETAGTRSQLLPLRTPDCLGPVVRVSRDFDLEQALAICHGAFAHGRFHRDFQLDPALADLRYDNWLRQLVAAGQVIGLFADQALAGFIAYSGNALVLHAVAPAWRGRGLAKYWWRAVITEMLDAGHDTIISSISAANMAVVNLYARQGFSFRRPQDIYHRIVK
jgi:L-amino acid N-acyltransferase YncA